MVLILHQRTQILICLVISNSFKLVAYQAIFVDEGTYDKIVCVIFNQIVAISADLVPASRSSNPKDGLPGILARQTSIKFVCEFETGSELIEVGVVKQITRRKLGKFYVAFLL